jgi:UDP-N-acetylmuramoylalanine--D-glutamate ligase
MESLKDTHVLVLGLGSSGLAMARWCARAGARVTVADTRDSPPGLADLQRDVPEAVFKAVAQFGAELIEGTDVRAVFRSPGLTPAQIEGVIAAATATGLVVGGELSLFWWTLLALKASRGYDPKVLAITGTNGKTTVTSLTGQLVERCGKRVAVAGNIGPTLLDTLTAYLKVSEGIEDQEEEVMQLPEVWVLELSSFQLDGVRDFLPTMGVVLNLSQDHLDWHGSMAAYAEAKSRIFGPHKRLDGSESPPMLLNREDPLVMQMLPALVKNKPVREHVSFGIDMPQRPGDWGLESVNGMTWLVRAAEADETQKRRKNDEVELYIQRLMPADALRIRGRHNAANALAALALASAAGCPLNAMLYGLREYRGEPHRVEPIGIINQIEYFDDSKGTNVGATAAALKGLGEERRVVVILGGDGKGQDFAPLAQPVSLYARAVVLIGRDAPLIEQALAAVGVPCVRAESMDEAARLACERAHPGDAVLMSPACASFDMFKNYEHRAEVFRAAVAQLALQAGVNMEQGV